MPDFGSRAATQAAIRAVLAADCACPESAFLEDGLLVTQAEERPGRRRYPLASRPLSVITMGRGVVVSCFSTWVEPLSVMLDGHERDELFSAPVVAELSRFVAREGGQFLGPALSHACAPESFRAPAGPDGLAITIIEGEAVFDLYQYPGFSQALSYNPDHPRPDGAAAVARRAGEIIGIAGMSADCETLWQIGVAVVAGERGGGIGRALVGRMTEYAFHRGRVPFYTADIANIRSLALAASLGYSPAWVELFTRDPAPATFSTTNATEAAEG